MQISSDDIQFLVGNFDILSQMKKTPSLPMFSDRAISFLSFLSRKLLSDKRTRNYTDVTAYSYWIRKASLENARQRHFERNNRIGRGVAFHIAPSNVPVNFAVSMTSSILAGNATIIRISNKYFEQVKIICDAMNSLLDDEFEDMKNYFCLIRYAHNDFITQKLSTLCDVRIIWGGNATIENIRNAKLPPRSIEMTFADRHSLAVINADEYLQMDALEVAKGFYTDTYYTDQNACSSPRLVVWTGRKIKEARELFWYTLGELVKEKYEFQPILAVDKYTAFCKYAMSGNRKTDLVSKENLVVRVEIAELTPELMDYKCGGGYFFEYEASNLEEIIPVLTKQCQTISVLGVERTDIKNLVFKYGVRGVDRIVPLGQTMGLEFIWDGYRMIESMSRLVYTGDEAS